MRRELIPAAFRFRNPCRGIRKTLRNFWRRFEPLFEKMTVKANMREPDQAKRAWIAELPMSSSE
jgi:hypothetical protein